MMNDELHYIAVLKEKIFLGQFNDLLGNLEPETRLGWNM